MFTCRTRTSDKRKSEWKQEEDALSHSFNYGCLTISGCFFIFLPESSLICRRMETSLPVKYRLIGLLSAASSPPCLEPVCCLASAPSRVLLPILWLPCGLKRECRQPDRQTDGVFKQTRRLPQSQTTKLQRGFHPDSTERKLAPNSSYSLFMFPRCINTLVCL